MRFTKIPTVFLILFCLTAFSVFVSDLSKSAAAENDKGIKLFRIATPPVTAAKANLDSPASLREAEIIFDGTDAFRNAAQLEIQVFDNKSHQAIRNSNEGLEIRGPKDFTWRGKISEGDFRGDVLLTFADGAVNGLIYTPDKGVFEIVTRDSKHYLVELDQSLFPECAGEVKPPVEFQKTDTGFGPIEDIGAATDSGDRIDVLVVYTNAVKTAVGGDTAANNLAQSAVDISNTAYLNSRIRQRLRLVHTAETALTEANSLSELRADATTAALRTTHKADMVAMLVNSLSGCGIGYVMTNVNQGFASSAYSITLRTCAVGNLTFAHELGHNMGSTHNPEDAGSAAYPYSYGHYVNGSYRTVMSYSNQCTSGCTRVAQFSNPAVIFNGVPTGILNLRDNFYSLENTADTVASFQYSGSSLTLNNYSNSGFLPRNLSKTINWSSDNLAGNVKIELSRDEGRTWETLNASTPNDGTEAINIYGRPTRRARIRVSNLASTTVSDSSVRNIAIK